MTQEFLRPDLLATPRSVAHTNVEKSGCARLLILATHARAQLDNDFGHSFVLALLVGSGIDMTTYGIDAIC